MTGNQSSRDLRALEERPAAKPGEENKCAAGTGRRAKLGPLVFFITLAGTLVFFWWLLIAAHGVPISH